ncbi:ADP-ribosylation factor-like protein 9 [Notothenia coriiceps]|uniref:ADP-ribosylation factor-like protein 9 n=1 Tax=Notothenia coriiceps TaxID=8208 RepID=A0A6I9PEF8_9TELE|nr:PREDICTED: ADP-ribosylation factor-like protein 9 [Notothenia coriiceps]
MFGLKTAGVIGASVAMAGGVAYVVWNYASSPGEKETETRPEEDGKKAEDEGEIKEEIMVEQIVVAAAVAPVVAAEAPKTPESKPVESAGTQVLVLGLDGAGKTSLLHCLSTGCLEHDMEPTQGFNAVSISREDLHIEFLESRWFRSLTTPSHRLLSQDLELTFIVKIMTRTKELELDLPGACSITDLHDALSLSEAGDRRLFLIGTHVKKGEGELSSGVQDARELILQMVSDSR